MTVMLFGYLILISIDSNDLFSDFFLFLDLIRTIHQTLKTAFDHINLQTP